MPPAEASDPHPTAGLLTLAEARRILGRGCPLSDEEIEALRDELTILANAVLDGLETKDAS